MFPGFPDSLSSMGPTGLEPMTSRTSRIEQNPKQRNDAVHCTELRLGTHLGTQFFNDYFI